LPERGVVGYSSLLNGIAYASPMSNSPTPGPRYSTDIKYQWRYGLIIPDAVIPIPHETFNNQVTPSQSVPEGDVKRYSLKFKLFLLKQFQAQINYSGIIDNCCVVGLIIDFLLFIWYNLAIYNEECNFKGMER